MESWALERTTTDTCSSADWAHVLLEAESEVSELTAAAAAAVILLSKLFPNVETLY